MHHGVVCEISIDAYGVTKLLPFEYRIYIIFDIELTNQATMSVAGRRRMISSTTWDLKGQRETAVH